MENKTSNKNKVISLIAGVASAVVVGLVGGVMIGELYMYNKTAKTDNTSIVVGFSADPAVTMDGEFKLGYPEHRYSISCSAGKYSFCMLEVEDGKNKTVKQFPYVEQEWFTPGMKNRPYHTLDVIKTLPSYNGNEKLSFTKDVKSNNNLYRTLHQNGWVE